MDADADATPAADEAAVDAAPPESAVATEVIYCCRRCRAPLFRPSLLAEHEVGAHQFSYHRMQKGAREIAGGGGGASSAGEALPTCTSHFLSEALKWMAAASADIEGKLLCPGCSVRVGTIAWAGSQCSCGTWVTPAIQIKKGVCDARVVELTSAPPPPPPPPPATDNS